MTRKWLTVIAISLLLSLGGAASTLAASIAVRIPQQPANSLGHNSYILELLELALEASKQESEIIDIRQNDHDLTQARQIAELRRGEKLDLIWTMSSINREAVIRPIRIPLLKGILGQRVFLVHEDRVAEFQSITHLQQLKDFTAGQGSHWPDTPILRHNGLSVITTTHYSLLFDMLAGGRFDYFPRGANEAWQEIDAHQKKPLVVEPTLMLSYIAPMYFFVSPDNESLAARIETGLEKMYDDGSFDRHFFQHPSISTMLKNIHIDERHIFRLDNPLLPKKTPVDIERYWLPLHKNSLTMKREN